MDAAVDALWEACLALTWEAYRAGTVPVGALVTAPDGAIVARGRNRILDGGPWVAHAEIEALSALTSDRRYEEYVVWSALEPCLMCLGATLMSTIRTIRYAAADPVGGACRSSIDVADYTRAGMRIEGPTDEWPGRLTSALQAAFWLGRASERSRENASAFDAVAGARIRAATLPERFEEARPRLLELL